VRVANRASHRLLLGLVRGHKPSHEEIHLRSVGVPLSAKAISGGREVWSYGGETLTFKGDRVIAASGKAHIGG